MATIAKWKAEHPDNVKAAYVKGYAKNKGKIAVRQASRRRKNPHKETARHQKYRSQNILKVKKKHSEYYAREAESIMEKARLRAAANPEKTIALRKISNEREKLTISDAYLAKSRKMPVDHLRQYPRPVIDLWKTLLKLSRIQKQINTEINEIEKRNE